MNLQEFTLSTGERSPPKDCPPMLEALWHLRKGDWKRAHEIAQAHEDEKPSAWVHAHLHRVEGDLSNAGYWYRRAGRKPADCALEEEWDALAAHFLEEKTPS
ncbi:MAG TPA: hypothetical protein VHB46_06395 [Burkholderiales bacterium]|nr:hypothetical protein [Burkholderiales bacterium]